MILEFKDDSGKSHRFKTDRCFIAMPNGWREVPVPRGPLNYIMLDENTTSYDSPFGHDSIRSNELESIIEELNGKEAPSREQLSVSVMYNRENPDDVWINMTRPGIDHFIKNILKRQTDDEVDLDNLRETHFKDGWGEGYAAARDQAETNAKLVMDMVMAKLTEGMNDAQEDPPSPA